MSSGHGFDYVYTADLGRHVALRPVTADAQVWSDTFVGRYHVPPGAMPVPRTVLDVGANIGLTAAHYRALWPHARVVAVEMDESNAKVARLNAPDVKVMVRAVTDWDGWASYDSASSSEAYAVVRDRVSALGSPRPDDTSLVRCHTLQRVVREEFGWEGVDFLKLDVEGMEWRLFATPGWVPLVRYLLVELHAVDGKPAPAHDRRLLPPEAPEPDDLVAWACRDLVAAGFTAAHWHPAHPQAVWAFR